MDIAAFERRAKELKLAEDLFNIRMDRHNDAKRSLSEAHKIISNTIESVLA